MSFALKYQAFLDKINNRIPIKWLTKPIDKIHPLMSLILFVLIILGILLLVFRPFGLAGEKAEYVTFTIGLADSNNQLLKNFDFQIKDYSTGITQNYRTNNTGQLSLQLNKFSDYSLIVEKRGYKSKEETIDLSKTKQNFIIEIFALASTQTKALTFVGANGQRINENLNVTITCQNGATITPATTTVANGSGSFEVPVSCLTLVATAIGTTYAGQNILINQQTGVVTVPPKELTTSYGRVTVRVKSGTNYLDGITLRIFSQGDNANPKTSGQTQMGSKAFANLEVGDYVVIATDDSLRYQTNQATFTITRNMETQVNIDMVSIQGEPGGATAINTRDIKILLKDADTSTELDATALASVILITDVNGTAQNVATKTYTSAGVMFRVDATKAYSVTARADGYIPQNRNITPNVNDYTIYLEKENISNVSNINVNVKDEDGLSVVGATLIIYDGNSNFQDTRFNSVVTDDQGLATFEEIPEGNFFIKLRKTNVLVNSTKFNHNPPNDSNISMNINVGEGTINLNIKNTSNEVINFANIVVYDINGDEIGVDEALQNGTYTRTLKADKIVFIKISKEGYFDYYTELLSIVNSETISKDIRLTRIGSTTIPTVEFAGLYNIDDQNANYLVQNSRYYFKFRIINPTAGNIGLRVSVGEQASATEDIAYIKPITNSKANISYYSNINLNPVVQDVPAKVADALFVNASPGTYELQITIATVQATRGQAVPIYYSVFTSTPPAINTLINQRVYYIDVSEICGEDFCISGQYVDNEDDIVYDLGETNGLIVNKNYNLSYILTNARSNIYTDNRLVITNVESSSEMPINSIDILSYDVSLNNVAVDSGNAGNQLRNKIPFTTDYLTLPQINVYDKLNIETQIKPAALGTTRFLNKIISDQSVVYNDFITFNVSQQYPFTITYEPQNIVPGKPFNLTVTALDEAAIPVNDAIVNIYQRLANHQLVTVTSGVYTTNDYGVATIAIPSLRNAERIIISVEKSGYYADPIEIVIDQDILSLKQGSTEVTDDNPFEINVHKSNPQGTEKVLTIVNKTDYTLQLKPFTNDSFSFSNYNYLNIGSLQTYLNGQVANISIPPNGEGTLRIKLSASAAADDLTETVNITGNIVGYVTVDNSETEYPFNIPMNVKVSVGDGVEEDDCLTFGQVSNPWQAVVSSNDTTTFSFDIVNNCKIKGNDEQSIELKTLRAKIVSQKDQYGYYTLKVDNRTITLAESSYTTLINDLSPGVHSAILTYYSLDKKIGDVETNIYINGQVETDDGLKYVNTTRDVAFTTNIAIRKIQDCFDFYDGSKKINDMLVIPKETFVGDPKEIIIKNNCSTLGTFRLSFCGENKDYAGCQILHYENMDGYLENQLTFNPGNDSQTAGIIKPEVPGGYIIPVRISILSDSGRIITTIEKRLKVNVHSSTGLYMEDPFIEVDKNSDGVYVSQPVRLLNSNIDKTPWDYATQKVGDTGFSKYMNSGNNDPAGSGFGLIKFKNVKDVDNQSIGDFWNNATSSGTIALGSGTTTAIITTIIAAHGGTAAIGTALASMFVPGLIIMGVFAIVGAAMPFYSDYKVDKIDGFLDVPLQYGSENFMVSKVIDLNSETSSAYINVFDITGEKYKTYMSKYIYAHGKLASDKTINTSASKCSTTQNLEPFFKKEFVYSNNTGCSDVVETETETKYNYSTHCNGSWPGRTKIRLKYETINVCKNDRTIWPEQAGIKPIIFNITDPAIINDLDRGDINYNTITFYPTLDDQVAGQDVAFSGAEEIGEFRFAIMAKQYPEKPSNDLNMDDCSTDAGKIGSTGVGALPKVKFDWQWNPSDMNNCSDGNQYCDATQLSQVIVNRIISADTQISAQRTAGNIVCPMSNSQITDQAAAGNYNLASTTPEWDVEEIPLGFTGLQQVRFGTDGNLTKILVSVENRTVALQSGQITIKFGNYVPVAYETLNSAGETITTPITSTIAEQVMNITIPIDDSTDYTFIYGTEAAPIIANDINLSVTYAGGEAYLAEPGYTSYQADINASIYQASSILTECQVPATTAQFNGVDYIDLWFNNGPDAYPQNVRSPWQIEDIRELKQTLEFDAYLITDNYNSQFLNDFDRTYGGQASVGDTSATGFLGMGTPGVYSNGIYSPLFRDNTTFTLQYANNQDIVNVLVPGLYKVRIDFIYNNSEWNLINNANDIDANVTVTFTYLRGPENDSVFYRMPFDGFVGLQNDNSYSRQNYGLGYIGDNIVIDKGTGNNRDLTTEYIGDSNPKKFLNVQFNKDFFKTNSDVETRGNLLTVKETTDDQVNLTYSPSIATPVLMKVSKNNLLPFTTYYQLQDNTGQAVTGNNSLGIWSGVSPEDPRYYDFSGDYVYSRFMNFYDRQTTSDEGVYNSYAIDWDTIAKMGNVYLRTIFYTPYNSQNSPVEYTLVSKLRQDKAKAQFPDNYEKTIGCRNENNCENTIDSVSNIFEKVKTNQVCVVNTDNGKITEFYWNPKAVYGTNNQYNGEGLDGIIN